ncbi:ABC transporter permease [Pseudomonas aeruginosa]
MDKLYYLGKRLGQGAFIVLLVSFMIFALLRVMSGDPVRLIVGGMAPDHVVEQTAKEMGLRDPMLVQYGRYLAGLVQGDMGQSFIRPKSGATMGGAAYDDPTRSERAEVAELIMKALPYTLQLAGLALAIALLVSLALGIPAGLNPGKWQDKLAFFTGSTFVSLPNFWLGIVLILILSVQLKWVPAIGYNGFSYTWLPAIVLAVELVPFITRTLSVSIAEIMTQPFIAAARSRGIGFGRIVFGHALRNASVPLLNLLGIQLSALIGGVLVIEFIFDYPGLGLLTIQAVLQRDFPLIQGIAIMTAVIFVCINIIVDFIAVLIDPRLDH